MDLSEALSKPQLWNRYTYSLNNPARYVDPDGRNPFLAAVVVAAAIAVLTTPDPANAPAPGDPLYKGDSSGGGLIASVTSFFGGEYIGGKLIGMATRGWAAGTGKAATQDVAQTILNAERVGSALKLDADHYAASWLTKDQLAAGKAFTIRGGDGVQRTLFQTTYSSNGKKGIVEYIIEDGKVTHQRFIKDGVINGIPNQTVPNK